MFQYLEMSPICNKHTPLSSAYSPPRATLSDRQTVSCTSASFAVSPGASAIQKLSLEN